MSEGETPEGKLATANKLAATLEAVCQQLAAQTALTQSLLEDNRALRESQNEAPRAAAGGNRARSNAGLMAELAKRVPKYQYTVSEPDSFKRWIARHKLTFVEDGELLTERERTRLLCSCLEENTYQRYVDTQRDVEDIYEICFEDTVKELTKIFGSHRSLMVRRQNCLQISRASGNYVDALEYTNQIGEQDTNAKLSEMCSEDWSVFLFLRGLDAPGDAPAKAFLMQYYETRDKKGEKVKLSDVYDEWQRFLQMKEQTKIVSITTAKSQPATDVLKIDTKEAKSSKKKKQESKSRAEKSVNKNVICFKCGEPGHTSPNCPKKGGTSKTKKPSDYGDKKTQSIQVDGLEVKENLGTKRGLWVEVEGSKLWFQLDTGSQISLINVKSYKRIGSPQLEKVPHRISCANGSEMTVMGRVRVNFKLKGMQYTEYVYVRDRDTNLMGMSWLCHSPTMREALEVLVNHVSTKENEAVRLERELKRDYPDVFSEGLGTCVKEMAQFRTVEGAIPIFKRPRPVPYGSQEAVENELKRLQEMGVIEPVTHAKWAAPIVVIKKKDSGKVRICADFRCSGLNASLKDEFHPLPTSEDIFGRLKGTVFSQIDLKDAYLQIKLDAESQKLAVINTHQGLFQYKRMAFGLKPAPAIFQKIIDKLISGLPGVAAYLDDVIVSASTYQEHEAILRKLLDRLREYGFRISPSKCSFAKPEISFLGFLIDAKGRRPDPKKTEVIRSMKAPEDQKQLASFLGAICFYSRFVPKMCNLRGPLDRLMKKDIEWNWTPVEQNAFVTLRNAVADSTMLSHFHEDWPIVVAADASKYGIGGVLLHINPEGVEVPIAHFARSLTETEQRYSQMEKEGLALVYTIKKCHKFIFGRKFKLQTDHKPLLAIFGSNKDLPVHSQNRLVRWATTLLSYEFELSYVSTSKFAKADWLSRVIQEYPRDEDDVVIAEVNDEDNEDVNICSQMGPVMLADISRESKEDIEICQLIQLHVTDSWKVKPVTEIERYWNRLKDRMKVIQGCLMIDERVVVPKSLQNSVLKQLHDGHPGVVRMKQKARSFVFWRGLDGDVERVVRQCDNCQEAAKMPRVVPLNPWPIPEAPWKRIHVDFAGPLDGTYFLVVVDAKTKYAEVKLTKRISAVATVDLLDEIFSIHGFPEVIVSDNGTQLTSQIFKNMCQSHGIDHKTTAVYYPRSNGAAERFVDTLKRGIAKIKGSGSVTQQVLNKFLFHYRNTPHAALAGSTPAECHFGRKIRTTMSLLLPVKNSGQIARSDEYQRKMKANYDKRNVSRVKKFQIGQKVYAKVQSGNKWKWEYGIIRRKIGAVIYEVQTGSRILRCHANQIRIRFGDNSREDVFEETMHELFFESSDPNSPATGKFVDNVDNPDSNSILRALGGESNAFDFPDKTQLRLDDDNGGGSRTRVSFDPCISFDSGSIGLMNRRSSSDDRTDEMLNMDNMNTRDVNDSSSRESSPKANTMNATGRVQPLEPSDTDVSRNDTSLQSNILLSHSLRRSQRERRPPNRYDPCSVNIGMSRGSNQNNDQCSTRKTRGKHSTSGRRHKSSSQGNVPGDSSIKGGDVGAGRVRPRWH